ncbi:MAG: hypothetical protein AB7U29_18310 [Desulfobulbus sp.]
MVAFPLRPLGDGGFFAVYFAGTMARFGRIDALGINAGIANPENGFR